MDGQKIFVSTVGDDSGDGSEEEPLRTLEKAIDVANEMREDSDKLIEILLREGCLLYTSPSPRDRQKSRMPSSA